LPQNASPAYSASMSSLPEPPSNEPGEQEISLRGLTEAFAQALGHPNEDGDSPEEGGGLTADAEEAPELSAEPPPEMDEAAQTDAACPISPRTILEAMLFVDNREGRPLDCRRASELMRGVEPSEIPSLVGELNRDYLANNRPYHVVGEGSGYRLALRQRYYPLRDKFHGRVRQARLSQVAIDVLAVVAYEQPLSADEVNRLRGKPSNHVLAQLVRRQLLRIERQAKPAKTLYRTTDRFLDLFGLESIEDLPQSEDLDRQ
jgi:segregation and condensation protein B